MTQNVISHVTGYAACQAPLLGVEWVLPIPFPHIGEKTMTGLAIVPRFAHVSNHLLVLRRPMLPLQHPDLHTLWQQRHALPAVLTESPLTMRYLDLIGPLAWHRLPGAQSENLARWQRPALGPTLTKESHPTSSVRNLSFVNSGCIVATTVEARQMSRGTEHLNRDDSRRFLLAVNRDNSVQHPSCASVIWLAC